MNTGTLHYFYNELSTDGLLSHNILHEIFICFQQTMMFPCLLKTRTIGGIQESTNNQLHYNSSAL